jgi:hypothetical protein
VTSKEWNTAVGSGLLRIVAGICLLRWRRTLARSLAGAAPDDRVMPLLFGYFGARDITVGAVTLAATRPTGNVPKAVRLQGLADATDAVLIGVVANRMPRVKAIGAIALAVVSALVEFATALSLKQGRATSAR